MCVCARTVRRTQSLSARTPWACWNEPSSLSVSLCVFLSPSALFKLTCCCYICWPCSLSYPYLFLSSSSIRPSSSTYLGLDQAEQDIPGALLPSNTFQFLCGDTQPERYNPSSNFWVYPGVFSEMCLGNLQRDAPRRQPNQIPKPILYDPFDIKSTQSSLQMFELLPLSQGLSPATSRRKFLSASWPWVRVGE